MIARQEKWGEEQIRGGGRKDKTERFPPMSAALATGRKLR